MSWVLILTLVVGGHYQQDGVSAVVTQVGGFETEEGCLRAGNAWLQKTTRLTEEKRDASRFALCAQVTK